jgi:hypothetical protein
MLVHGFTAEMLIELVTARLATAQTERMVVGGSKSSAFASRRWAGRRFRSFDGPDSQRTSLSRLSGRNGARAITTCSPTVPWSAAS